MSVPRHTAAVIAVVFLAASFGATAPTASAACECGGTFTAKQAFDASKAVFSGTVTSVSSPNFVNRQTAPRVALFLVDTWWKGDAVAGVEVATGDGVDDCGFHFAEGERYLVYAQDGAANGQALVTSECSRTDTVRHLNADLAALGAGTAAPPPPPEPPRVTPESLGPAAAGLGAQTAVLQTESLALFRAIIAAVAKRLPRESAPYAIAVVLAALALPLAVAVMAVRRAMQTAKREAQARHERLQQERLELAEKINALENERLAAEQKKNGSP